MENTLLRKKWVANLRAGMVKDSAQRLNNWLDCAAIDGKDAKDSARTQAKARREYKHLCHCITHTTVKHTRELLPLFTATAQRYVDTYGY